MQYGKVLTYRDIEEAKKLIGKKVAYSNCLSVIENLSDDFPFVGVLKEISEKGNFYIRNEDSEVFYFQFIREVIDEPKFRPYDSPTELVQDYLEIFKRKDIPKHTLPLIWLKHIPSDDVLLITGFNFDDEYVLTSEGKMTMSELHAEWNYLDGTPCAKRI